MYDVPRFAKHHQGNERKEFKQTSHLTNKLANKEGIQPLSL